VGAVGFAIDDQRAGSADAFTTVMVEGDRFLSLESQVFIHHIQHLQKGHVGIELRGFIGLESAGIRGVLLSPDFESDFHGLCMRRVLRF
jgi:hypothetical protein